MDTAKIEALNSLLKGVANLPSLPAIAVRIIQEVKKDKSSLKDLAKIIAFDPALSTNILKVANSSFYGLPYKVESTDRAVNIIGLEALKNIALSFVIVRGLKKDTVDEFDHELFLKRSITAAVCNEMIASKLKVKREDTFVTPLLMDIGVLIMYLSKPNDYIKIIDEKRISKMTATEAEMALFGFDHQDVGSEILKRWGIPENIYLPIAYHHNGQECPSELSDMVDFLMISDLTSAVYHGNQSIEKIEELEHLLMNRLNTTEAEVSEFIDSVAERTIEILSSFEIDPGEMKPYSKILQEANEELGKLNLTYEQLVMQLKQEKMKVESLARELKSANEKLAKMAYKDGLTGLYNHRFFQDLLDKELERTERYSRTLSLIMIDIDHFKKVNDEYGHQQGDIVLRTIARIFEKAIRKTDVVARYGGEEFVIVLPETDIKGAAVLAERLRHFIQKFVLKIGDKKLRVTISLGVTAYDPGRGKKKKSQIIEAADKALYNSKATGRNKLSIIM